jgi:hypothetical protein
VLSAKSLEPALPGSLQPSVKYYTTNKPPLSSVNLRNQNGGFYSYVKLLVSSVFLAFGLCGITAFYIVYIRAIDLAGISVAAVLVYTLPRVWR